MIAAFVPEIIGVLIAFVMQAVVAPYLAIGLVVPNVLLAYAVAFSVASERTTVSIMPFIAGLAFDLLGSGPVGGMALLTLVVCFASTFIVARFGDGSLFMPIVTIIAAIFLADILYAFICVTCGWDVGLGEALLHRSLPCGLYDTVIALLIYTLCRFIRHRRATEMDMPSIG